MLNGCGSGVGVGTGTIRRCGVDFTKATGGDVAGASVALGSGATTILTAVGSGVVVEFTKATGGDEAGIVVALGPGATTILTAVGSGVGAGVELTKATGGDLTDTAVDLGSGATTILTGADSAVGAGVEVLAPGVETALKGGAADVIKVLVTAEDFGSTSTLVPAFFLTQSSISGSKRSRSFARACSRSTAI
jgi:hypothetical protein